MGQRILYRFHTPYNRGRILLQGERINMEVQGATFATWHPRRLLTGYSWDALAAAPLLHVKGQPQDVLVLGLAAGTMVRTLKHLWPACRITAVDIDRELIEVSQSFMHLDADALTVHIGDAYEWLASTRDRFDVILDDVYLAGDTDVYKPTEQSKEPAALYRRALRKDGLVAVNLITDRPHLPILNRVQTHLRETFRCLTSITPPKGYNRILVAGDRLTDASVIQTAEQKFIDPLDRRFWRGMALKSESAL